MQVIRALTFNKLTIATATLSELNYSKRIPNQWNQLPPYKVGALSLPTFKSRIDLLWLNKSGAIWPNP